MPIAVAVVALTAGLALMTFVKAYGIAFLARPRAEAAADATESGTSMTLASGLAAAAVVALGLVPGVTASAAARAAGLHGVGSVGVVGVDLAGTGALLDPVALSLMALTGAAGVLVVSVVLARRRAAPTGRAGVGVRRRPREPADAVHRHLLRRAPVARVRRRAAARARPAGEPHRASRATSSSASSSTRSSTTSSRRGPTAPPCGSSTGSESSPAGCRTAASTATWRTRSWR